MLISTYCLFPPNGFLDDYIHITPKDLMKVHERHVIKRFKLYSRVKFSTLDDCLTHEDLARCFCVLLLLLLAGLPSIFLYMACSAPLCSECFFTSLESSAWIVYTEETRQIGAAGSSSTPKPLPYSTRPAIPA